MIWGCGGHAREVLHLCKQIGIEVVGFLDERPEWKGQIVDDVPVLGDLPDIIAITKSSKDRLCWGWGPCLKKTFC